LSSSKFDRFSVIQYHLNRL